jgi:Mrp family chromosome partitioning ATPase
MLQELTTERPKSRANGSLVRRSKLSAHYEALLYRIHLNLDASIGQAIGVTSIAPRSGVSTVALNLAITADSAGYGPVLLIDADIHKRPKGVAAKEVPRLGLIDALSGAADPLDCVYPSAHGNVSTVSGRGLDAAGGSTIERSRFAEVLDEYKQRFKLLIVDIPTPSELNNSIGLASKLDGVLLVIEAERADGRVALKTKQQLVDARANLLGVVLNKRPQHVPGWLYRRL